MYAACGGLLIDVGCVRCAASEISCVIMHIHCASYGQNIIHIISLIIRNENFVCRSITHLQKVEILFSAEANMSLPRT
jgi:hypothetical protein